MKHVFMLCLFTAFTVGCTAKHPELIKEIQAVKKIDTERTYANQGQNNWQAGQWVRYLVQIRSTEEVFRLVNTGPADEVHTIAITGHEKGSVWLEQHIIRSKGETHIAGLLTGVLENDFAKIEIKQLKFRGPSGKMQIFSEDEIQNKQAETAREAMQFLIDVLMQSTKSGRYRNITVPAGTFLHTKDIPFSFSTLLGQEKGNILYSSAVPVLGFARLQSERLSSAWFIDTVDWRLVDFGVSGGKSVF